MKRFIFKIHGSKFKKFTECLFFAFISVISLIHAANRIMDYNTRTSEILIPFIVAIISFTIGFILMIFRKSEVGKAYILNSRQQTIDLTSR